MIQKDSRCDFDLVDRCGPSTLNRSLFIVREAQDAQHGGLTAAERAAADAAEACLARDAAEARAVAAESAAEAAKAEAREVRSERTPPVSGQTRIVSNVIFVVPHPLAWMDAD